MSSVGCPRCEESFRVPDAPLPPEIRLRCPWCMETFKLADLSTRLLPMVELIDDDDQAIELSSLFSTANAVAGPFMHASTSPPMFASDDAFSNDKTVEIDKEIDKEIGFDEERSELDEDEADLDEMISLDASSDDSSAALDSEADEIEYEPTALAAGLDGFDEPANPEAAFESADAPERTFDSDQFDIGSDDTRDEFDDGEEHDPYQTIVEHGDRVPVTGPVAPRPLTPPPAHDFKRGGLKAKPRPKKQGSPLKQIIGVVSGFLLSVPIAAMLLSYVGKPLNLGFWPFDGTPLTQIVAGKPMSLPDEPSKRPTPQDGSGGRPLGEEMNRNLLPTDEMNLPDSTATTNPITDETTVPDANPTSPMDTDILKDLMTDAAPKNNDVLDIDSDPRDTAKPVDTPSLVMPENPSESISMADDASAKPAEPITPPVAAKPMTPDEAAFNDIVSGEPKSVEKPEPTATPPLSVSFDPPATPELIAAIENVDLALEVVANFKDKSDVKGFRSVKGNVYTQLAGTAFFPQSSSQEETTAVIKRVFDAGLMGDMITIGPNWMVHRSRTDGFFGVGKLVQANGRWILKWNGSDLQLQNVDVSNFGDGDVDVYVIGKIVDASPPAIVRVVYMAEQATK